MMNFIRQTMLDKGTPSYSRLWALPFFVASFLISVADGIVSLYKGMSALDAAATLALTGMTLFTGSKYLSSKGDKAAPTPPSEKPTQKPAPADELEG